MKELARLIRQGLAQKKVKEDSLVWGAGLIRGRIEANIIGLALIGKLGVELACQLFEKAISESLSGEENCPVTQRVLKELGLTDVGQTEELVALHNLISAENIAQMLEVGELHLCE